MHVHLRAGASAPRAIAIAATALTCLTLTPATAGAESTLARLAAAWSNVRDYSVTIDAHEVLANRTEDRELQYALRRPAQARLDLMSGKKSVARILWNGGTGVVAYRPGGISFLRIHGNAHGRNFTSLRGNGVLTPNFGAILACFEAHKDAIEERPGPAVDGKPTDEIRLRGAPVQCANDPPADKGITLDVIDVSQRGEIVMRKRYEAARLVESWHLRDYRINAGLSAGDFN